VIAVPPCVVAGEGGNEDFVVLAEFEDFGLRGDDF
jgi:hypothetical protein